MRYTIKTRLIAARYPTATEKRRGAEVAFDRKSADGRTYTILARRCYESWEQWGEVSEILCDNVDAVEKWRLEGLS